MHEVLNAVVRCEVVVMLSWSEIKGPAIGHALECSEPTCWLDDNFIRYVHRYSAANVQTKSFSSVMLQVIRCVHRHDRSTRLLYMSGRRTFFAALNYNQSSP